MAEYLPLYEEGQAFTSQASAALTAGQMVAVSATGTVGVAGANAIAWVGIAGQDTASGDKVTIRCGGVQRPIASGTVTAGDLVVCAASGKVSTLAAVTTPTAADVTNSRAIVGIALTTAADGVAVEVKFER
jgi:sulfate adenylyltransferase subunit 1 (EFTu-like GTPase family)